MRKSKSRIFVVNDKEYIFDPVNFKIFYKKMQSVKKHPQGDAPGTKITEVAFREAMADELGISSDAIKNWIYGYNGPSDIDMIQAAAKYLNINFMEILVENEGEQDMMVNNQNNKIYEMKVDAVKGLFDLFCEVLEDYQKKYGYNEYLNWELVSDNDYPNPYSYPFKFDPIYGVEKRHSFDDVITEIRKAALFIPIDKVVELEGIATSIFREKKYVEGGRVALSTLETSDEEEKWYEEPEYVAFMDGLSDSAMKDEFFYQKFAEYKANQYFKEIRDILRDIL